MRFGSKVSFHSQTYGEASKRAIQTTKDTLSAQYISIADELYSEIANGRVLTLELYTNINHIQ